MLRDTRPDLGESQDLWRVWLAGGERTMSLEMLDALFEDGVITVDTQVCPPDGTSFARLGEIAGLDESVSEEPGVDVDMAPSVRPVAPVYPATHAPVYPATHAPVYPATHAPVHPAYPAADSMRPMAMSLDLGADMAAMQPGFSFKKLLLVPVALAVLGIIAIAASAGASTEVASSVSAASMRTEIAAPVVETPTTTPTPAPEPVVARAPAPPPAAAAPVLTDAQKKALALKDKKAERAAAAKAKRAATPAPRKSSGKASSPFSKGGNAHDPLNGSL